MDRVTGKAIDGAEHLRQSIQDILSTPIGSRVMRRGYGSRLFALIDAPINNQTIIDLYAATAEALAQWEPRIKVLEVTAELTTNNQLSINLLVEQTVDGARLLIDGIIVQ